MNGHIFISRQQLSLYALAGVWGLALVVWPIGTNHLSVHEDSRQVASGESLYKSQLTTANFGLLGVQFYESNDGVRRWNIRSHFAELHRKENYAFQQQVEAEFYASLTGNIVFTKSDFGKSYLDKNQIELEGNVAVRSRRGYLFTMDRLTYFGEKHYFETKEPVIMRGPNPEVPMMQLRGVGMWADIDQEHFIMKHHVTAIRKLKSNETLRIQSNTGEFFTDDQKAVFRGGVRALMPSVVIDSDVFSLTIRDDKESIFAQGHVVLKNKDRVGHAEAAEIEIGSNQIVLEGKASIDSKGSQITGERITMYTDDDRIDVEEAQGRVHQQQ